MNQQWEIVYTDEIKPALKAGVDGDLNEKYGLHNGRPFYVVSAMDSERYLDLVGNNMVIKTPNGRSSQKWWFDDNTKTIKSWRTKSYSWTVAGNGKSSQITVGGTNSRWW